MKNRKDNPQDPELPLCRFTEDPSEETLSLEIPPLTYDPSLIGQSSSLLSNIAERLNFPELEEEEPDTPNFSYKNSLELQEEEPFYLSRTLTDYSPYPSIPSMWIDVGATTTDIIYNQEPKALREYFYEDHQVLIITSEAGMGKTTELTKFSNDLQQSTVYQPFFYQASDVIGQTSTIIATAEKHQKEKKQIPVIIIDTLDPYATGGGEVHLAEAIDQFAARGLRLVLASRPEEAQRIEKRSNNSFKKIALQKLTKDDVLELWKNLKPHDSSATFRFSRLIENAEENDSNGILEFLNIPLHLKLFSEVFAFTDEDLSDLNPQKLIELFYQEKVLSQSSSNYQGLERSPLFQIYQTENRAQEFIADKEELLGAIALQFLFQQKLQCIEDELPSPRSSAPLTQSMHILMVDHLVSEGLLVKEGNQYRFFHQTFFEKIAAQQLLKPENQNLLEELLDAPKKTEFSHNILEIYGKSLLPLDRYRFLKKLAASSDPRQRLLIASIYPANPQKPEDVPQTITHFFNDLDLEEKELLQKLLQDPELEHEIYKKLEKAEDRQKAVDVLHEAFFRTIQKPRKGQNSLLLAHLHNSQKLILQTLEAHDDFYFIKEQYERSANSDLKHVAAESLLNIYRKEASFSQRQILKKFFLKILLEDIPVDLKRSIIESLVKRKIDREQMISYLSNLLPVLSLTDPLRGLIIEQIAISDPSRVDRQLLSSATNCPQSFWPAYHAYDNEQAKETFIKSLTSSADLHYFLTGIEFFQDNMEEDLFPPLLNALQDPLFPRIINGQVPEKQGRPLSSEMVRRAAAKALVQYIKETKYHKTTQKNPAISQALTTMINDQILEKIGTDKAPSTSEVEYNSSQKLIQYSTKEKDPVIRAMIYAAFPREFMGPQINYPYLNSPFASQKSPEPSAIEITELLERYPQGPLNHYDFIDLLDAIEENRYFKISNELKIVALNNQDLEYLELDSLIQFIFTQNYDSSSIPDFLLEVYKKRYFGQQKASITLFDKLLQSKHFPYLQPFFSELYDNPDESDFIKQYIFNSGILDANPNPEELVHQILSSQNPDAAKVEPISTQSIQSPDYSPPKTPVLQASLLQQAYPLSQEAEKKQIAQAFQSITQLHQIKPEEVALQGRLAFQTAFMQDIFGISPLTDIITQLLRYSIQQKLEDLHFHASEDSRLFAAGINRLIEQFPENNTLVDPFTGSNLIPLGFLSAKKVDQCIGIDKFPKVGQETREYFLKAASQNTDLPPERIHQLQGSSTIIEADFFTEEGQNYTQTQIQEQIPENSRLLFSANPPWEPTPPEFNKFLEDPEVQTYILRIIDSIKTSKTHNSNIDDIAFLSTLSPKIQAFINYCQSHEIKPKNLEHIFAISGGVDGMKFVEPLFEFMNRFGDRSKGISLNVASIGNIDSLCSLIEKYDLTITHVTMMETYGYGWDQIPLVQGHYQELPGNYYLDKDQNGQFRYQVINLCLSPKSQCHQSRNTISIDDFKQSLISYRNSPAEFTRLNSSDNYDIYQLPPDDHRRILSNLQYR